jgi:hypothetical protein
LPTTNAWNRRVHFPSQSIAGLGWGLEYWDREPTNYEAHDSLRDRITAVNQQRGRKRPTPTRSYMVGELATNLLDDVVFAAGGVERAYLTFGESIDRLRQFAIDNKIAYDPAILRQGIATEDSVDAAYGFADLISWCRTFEERLDRRATTKRLPQQGLAHRLGRVHLQNRVGAALSKLRSGPVSDARKFTNFSLHAGLVHGPFSGARIGPNGIELPMPDVPTKPVMHWQVFTWNDNNDAVEFAGEPWAAVKECMDEILDAFESSTPRRFKVAPVGQ